MATRISSISLSRVFFATLLLLLLLLSSLCSLEKAIAIEAKDITKNYFHTLHITSLPPSNVCNRSSKVLSKGSFLEVFHKHGPCNPYRASIAPSLTEILRRDKLRVDSIYGKHATKTRVPFIGVPGGDSDYLVRVGFGTPKQEVRLLFDTGSDIIWTQCKPCKPCYPNPIPAFDPTHSTSYTQASCSSTQCKVLLDDGGSCMSSKCNYEIGYEDNSSAKIVLAKDTLTIKASGINVFNNTYFGCGFQVAGKSIGESGVLGLNRSPLSFSSQIAQKSNSNVIFSYCIPSTPGTTGYLTFQRDHVPNTVKFSPISKLSKSPQDYDLEMVGISVGARKPLINASLFEIPRVAIDSGTVITRFSPKTYGELRSMFRELMKRYKLLPKSVDDFLDTCYDFTNSTSVTIPAITVFFQGGVEVDIDVSGILITEKHYPPNVYCFAFAALDGPEDDQRAIFGNVQQKKYTIVFDAENERIGFAPNGCN